jgi:hypothetical protein
VSLHFDIVTVIMPKYPPATVEIVGYTGKLTVGHVIKAVVLGEKELIAAIKHRSGPCSVTIHAAVVDIEGYIVPRAKIQNVVVDHAVNRSAHSHVDGLICDVVEVTGIDPDCLRIAE